MNTPTTAAEALDVAADVLERHSWTRGKMYREADASCCVLGALAIAGGHLGELQAVARLHGSASIYGFFSDDLNDAATDPVLRDAVTYLADEVGHRSARDCNSVFVWNDGVAWVGADVRNHLRSAAERARRDDERSKTIEVTRQEAADAFTEWERQVRLNPRSFRGPVETMQETPETIGKACANALLDYLEQVRAGYAAAGHTNAV